MLWGRAAQRCAYPKCVRELVMDATLTDDESLVGEDCHIVAQSDGGPRGPRLLTNEDSEAYSHLVNSRDTYANLILLCRIHHKLVDDQPSTYPIAELLKMKQTHESWVRQSLSGFDAVHQRSLEIYAGYIEEWASRVDLEEWADWTSSLLLPDPAIDKARFDSLKDLTLWILNRIWPTGFVEIECGLGNFSLVLNDLLSVFKRHSTDQFREGELWTERFYKSDGWSDRYDELLNEYNDHIDLIHDLVLELTRAGNYVCDQVRALIEPSFRMREGALLVHRYSQLDLVTIRPEYKPDERTPRPYPGLNTYLDLRSTRRHYIDTKDTGIPKV